MKVSSLHLRFLQPMPPGIDEIMKRFKQGDDDRGQLDATDPKTRSIDEDNRRYSALAMMLRSRYLVDVDCWSEVRGQPIKPGTIERVLRDKTEKARGNDDHDHPCHRMPAASCTRSTTTLEDYQGGVPRWCTGCGDNAILAAVQRLCRDEDLRPRRRCSSRASAARAASRTT